jgi:hypothetical protein
VVADLVSSDPLCMMGLMGLDVTDQYLQMGIQFPPVPTFYRRVRPAPPPPLLPPPLLPPPLLPPLAPVAAVGIAQCSTKPHAALGGGPEGTGWARPRRPQLPH